MDKNNDAIQLTKQLTFPLYACSRELIKLYKPFLDELDLTYTQYITMLVLWERKSVTAKALGNCLYLDSGTLTPLLKKLEEKGLVTRRRSEEDERNLIVTITPEGADLKDRSVVIPFHIGDCPILDPEEAETLYRLLRKVLTAKGKHLRETE